MITDFFDMFVLILSGCYLAVLIVNHLFYCDSI